MARLAFSDFPEVEISDMEMRRTGKSYTSDTLLSLKKEGRELFLLVGGDMLLTLDSWHEFRTIFSLATVCAVKREADVRSHQALCDIAARYKREYGARILMIDAEPLPISSSVLRARIIEGKDGICKLMDSRVLGYIKDRGLYV